MDQDIDKKMDAWFASVGKDAFLALNAALDTLIEQVQAITDQEEILGAIEGEVLNVLSRVTEKEKALENINTELSLYNLEASKAAEVRRLFEKFITDHDALMAPEEESGSKKEVSQRVSSPNTPPPNRDTVLANLQKNLTQPSVIAPVTREHSVPEKKDAVPPSAPSVPQEKKFDPYREQI